MSERGRFIKMSREELLTPQAPHSRVLQDHWWPVDAEGNVYLYGDHHSPQANTHRAIAEKAQGWCPGAVGVELIPLAFLPHRCSGY